MPPGPDDLVLPPGARGNGAGAGMALDPAIEAKIEAAIRAGIFCTSCGERMDEDGWQYISIRTEVTPQGPVVRSAVAYICNREQCTEARASLEKSAAARRPWPAWHIFDVEVPDTPPADAAPAPSGEGASGGAAPGDAGAEPPESS